MAFDSCLGATLDLCPESECCRILQTHAPPDLREGGCPRFLELRNLRI
jgi:hypothetical protein